MTPGSAFIISLIACCIISVLSGICTGTTLKTETKVEKDSQGNEFKHTNITSHPGCGVLNIIGCLACLTCCVLLVVVLIKGLSSK